MKHYLMKCGHVDNARMHDKEGNPTIPSCVICLCHETMREVEATDGLEERMAKCHCGKTVPSSWDLAFFEFRGEGSHRAQTACKCGYFKQAHGKPHIKCKNFEPHGVYDFDIYYCGCDGWD